MIKIDRASVETPNSLVEAGGKGPKETNKAISFYSDDNNLDESYPFKAYKSKDVKDALKILFNNKCAYCESKITNVSFGHIEHFRPKNGIKIENALSQPGYYWLASTWENLFLSCERCNCINRDVNHEGIQKSFGKGNQFPIEDETNRSRKHDDMKLKLEKPYLLNPCEDNPENHLNYNDKGLIIPKILGGVPSEKGRKSIEIYGLFREPLVKSRVELYNRIMYRINSINSQLNTLHIIESLNEEIAYTVSDNVLEKIGDITDNILEEIEQNFEELTAHLNKEREYLGLARQLILPFLDQLRDELD